MELYRNIKKNRLDKNWTQAELAVKMGYSDKSMIAKIENGKVDLPQSKIKHFAEVFGVKPGDLMGWTEDYDVLNIDDKILYYCQLLNDLGIQKLIERAEELAEIPKYCKD